VDSVAAITPEKTSQSSDRDLRLDACRGIALWFIVLDHVPGNIGSWFTLSHYGFSDATELFMFVSGVTCAPGLRPGSAARRLVCCPQPYVASQF
jgi:hypothetical protein